MCLFRMGRTAASHFRDCYLQCIAFIGFDRPVPIVFVKCEKVVHWTDKKLAKIRKVVT